MDIELAPEIKFKKSRKNLLLGILSLALLVGGIGMTRYFLRSRILRSEITVSKVETGLVENTLPAAGEVLPEFEEVITSPVQASIKRVLLDIGAKIDKGQSVLTLNKAATENEYLQQKFGLESKQNEIRKLKLNLEKSFFDIRSANAIKQLRISNLQAAVENAKQLFKAGGGTHEGIEQAELNLEVAALEKKQLENEIRSKQQTMQVEEREAEIAASVQQNSLNELSRKLHLADVMATKSGIVTYVNKNIGASIKEGEVLARIADLSSYKIAGTISDTYLDQLHTGMPAIIRINDMQFRGHLTNISPAVQNGIVSYEIELQDSHNKLLRPNMKVDVFLVTVSHDRVMRIANGAAFKGPGMQQVYVVSHEKAEKRNIVTGLMNFDYVEIRQGLIAGDQVITSDLSEYKNAGELTIINK